MAQHTITLTVEHLDVIDVDFLQGMLNRMDMSYVKYKHPKETVANGVDYVLAIKERLKLYERGGEYHGHAVKAGNIEFLMDIANFNMCEFIVMGGIKSVAFNPLDSETTPIGLPTSDGGHLHAV